MEFRERMRFASGGLRLIERVNAFLFTPLTLHFICGKSR